MYRVVMLPHTGTESCHPRRSIYEYERNLMNSQINNHLPVRSALEVGFTQKRVRNLKKRKAIKRAVIKYLLISAVVITSLIYGIYQINKFFDEKRIIFKTPVIFQAPIQIESRAKDTQRQVEVIHPAKANDTSGEATAPITTKAKADPGAKVNEVVDAIYQLESSSTNSKGCAAKNLYNGYGYAPGTCYKSHEEVKALVTKWVAKRINKMPIGELLCGYNLGFDHDHFQDCVNKSPKYPYYLNYLSIN